MGEKYEKKYIYSLDYSNFELKNNGIKIRHAKDLEVIQSPMDKWEYSHCLYSFYWNKDSDMVVEIKGKGYYIRADKGLS